MCQSFSVGILVEEGPLSCLPDNWHNHDFLGKPCRFELVRSTRAKINLFNALKLQESHSVKIALCLVNGSLILVWSDRTIVGLYTTSESTSLPELIALFYGIHVPCSSHLSKERNGKGNTYILSSSIQTQQSRQSTNTNLSHTNELTNNICQTTSFK